MQVCLFRDPALLSVVRVWNRTAKGRALFYPLTPEKVRLMVLDRPHFDPDGFLLVRDGRGIAGGVVVSARARKAADRTALLLGIFDRGGDPGRYAQAALDAGLDYCKRRRMTTLKVAPPLHVFSHDLSMIHFLWHNRFITPTAHDPVIKEDVAQLGVFAGRDLADFRVPAAIRRLQRELEAKGYRFRFDVKRPDVAAALETSRPPFGGAFQRFIRNPSPLEDLMLVFDRGGRPVGGALGSLPGGPNEWVNYGCNRGLFGPIGVLRRHRGGPGKVLLFRVTERLRARGCRSAIIPIAPSIIPFYAKAGYRVERVSVAMQRRVGTVRVRRV